MQTQQRLTGNRLTLLPCWPFKRTLMIRTVGFLTMLLLIQATIHSAYSEEAAKPKSQTIVLIIDFGDGFQKHFTRIHWSKDMTVLNALQNASKHPRGLRFHYRGKGKTAFLHSIDMQKNEGTDRNWIYRVNGELGTRSFAIFNVKPSDTILWKFGKYR